MDYKSLRDKTNEVIRSYLPKENSKNHKEVIEALTYSFEIGGKRIRPLLMYSSYELSYGLNQVDEDVIVPFMAAMEMIHTYSLIHDDLPAMDNDDLRRGQATCHKAFDEATAILAGDGLLNYAYELLISHTLSVITSNPTLGIQCLKATKILAESAGIYGMIGGQAADIKFESEKMNEKEDLDYIHRNKTGSIIKACLIIGGVLASASANELEKLGKIGGNIGLAFQIQDDILDEISSEDVLGKPIGSDSKNNKKTYISFEGLEQSKKDVRRLLDEAITLTEELEVEKSNKENKNSLLKELIEFLARRKY